MPPVWTIQVSSASTTCSATNSRVHRAAVCAGAGSGHRAPATPLVAAGDRPADHRHRRGHRIRAPTGLFHRDLKPANILMDESNEPHVVDFGLAVQVTSSSVDIVASWPAAIPYMAPEQVRGEVHRLDGRTDIWALGCDPVRAADRRSSVHGETRRSCSTRSSTVILVRHDKSIQLSPKELTRICLGACPNGRSIGTIQPPTWSTTCRLWLLGERPSRPRCRMIRIGTPAGSRAHRSQRSPYL